MILIWILDLSYSHQRVFSPKSIFQTLPSLGLATSITLF